MNGVSNQAQSTVAAEHSKEPLWHEYVPAVVHGTLDAVAIGACFYAPLVPVAMGAKAADACLYLAQGDTWSAGVAAAEISPFVRWGRVLGEAGEVGLKWGPKVARWVRPLMEAASGLAKPMGEALNGAGKIAKGLARGNPGLEAAAHVATQYAGPALKGSVRVTVMKQVKPVLHDYLPPGHHQEWMLLTANNPLMKNALLTFHASSGLPGKAGEPGDGLLLTREEREKSTNDFIDSMAKMRQDVVHSRYAAGAPAADAQAGTQAIESMQQSLLNELDRGSGAAADESRAPVQPRAGDEADAAIESMQVQLQRELTGTHRAAR